MTGWLLSLVWFVAALALSLGSAPFAYLAWGLPAWLLFRRTARRWADAGVSQGAVSEWLPRAGVVLAVVIILLVAWSSAHARMAPGPNIFDVAFAGVFALSLLYPLVFVVWVIARSRRLATEEQG